MGELYYDDAQSLGREVRHDHYWNLRGMGIWGSATTPATRRWPI